MSLHQGSCHCGAIRLTLAETPSDAGECNCSLCRRIGGLWHHCVLDAVRVEGDLQGYVQGDCMLTTWHCPTCGCTTHWTPLGGESTRMGVNLRMFEAALWQDLPRRLIDGASF